MEKSFNMTWVSGGPLFLFSLVWCKSKKGLLTPLHTTFPVGVQQCIVNKAIVNTVKLFYTGPSENRSSQFISRFFKSLPNNSLQRKSHKTGHPSRPAKIFGPSAGRFREVSVYTVNSHHLLVKLEHTLNFVKFSVQNF
jgi:hypothetical protein